jgi:hypothetical protein
MCAGKQIALEKMSRIRSIPFEPTGGSGWLQQAPIRMRAGRRRCELPLLLQEMNMEVERDSMNQSGNDGSGDRDGAADSVDRAPDARATTREQMVAEAAYYHAERHGFTPEDALADWFQAENDIDGTAP